MTGKNSREQRRAILAKYNVFHDINERQASGHEATFGEISELAETVLDKYSYVACAEVVEKPWRKKTLGRAKAISEGARRCLAEHKNEAGWRLQLEPHIFKRFEVEVACADCRARLWRSELEAAATDPQVSMQPLQERRAMRKPCHCVKHRKSVEKYDDGLNNLFEDRTEDGMIHDEAVMCALQKKREEPDRIWGLRKTKRIERILTHERPANSGSVGESVRTSPFAGDASRLLYPYLVLESKSEKSNDSFSDINTQTGLIVRNLLNLQHEFVLQLPETAQTNMQDRCIPLVWVVSSKGEFWRVSGAYISQGKAGIEYHILDLWDGRLVYERDSLRLLLILDCIFDWARDIYRRFIIDGLLSLVRSPSNSLRTDTDILSITASQPDFVNFENRIPEGKSSNVSNPGKSSTLRFYDRPGLSLRDSSFMSHNVVGLQITGENLDDFLKSVSQTEDEIYQLARCLERNIHSSNCWLVTAECLSNIEKVWTGRDREPEVFQNPQQQFLVCFTVMSFFGISVNGHSSRTIEDKWLQVHKLGFVAIAQDAMDKLQKMLDCNECQCLGKSPQFSTQEVVGVFEGLRNAPVRQCLAAAIQRLRVSSSDTENLTQTCSTGKGSTSNIQDRRPLFIKSQAASLPLFELLEQVHRKLKPGMMEPTEQFLLTSISESEHLSNHPECVFWPTSELNIGHEELAVFVSRPEISILGVLGTVRRCIFLLPPSANGWNAYNPQQGQRHVSVHVLEMCAGIGQMFNRPCFEKLCKREITKALELLYHVSTSYFDVVKAHSGFAWRDAFGEWQLKDHHGDLEFPPGRTREQWLGLLRDAGGEFKLSGILEPLINAYVVALRSSSGTTEPKANAELMPRSSLHICDCSPTEIRRGSDGSSSEKSRRSNSPVSRRGDQPHIDGLNSELFSSLLHRADLDIYISDTLSDADGSMSEDRSDSTPNEDEPPGAASGSRIFMGMPVAETSFITQLGVGRTTKNFTKRGASDKSSRTRTADSRPRTRSTSSTSEAVLPETTKASTSIPSKRRHS